MTDVDAFSAAINENVWSNLTSRSELLRGDVQSTSVVDINAGTPPGATISSNVHYNIHLSTLLGGDTLKRVVSYRVRHAGDKMV